MKNRKVEFSDLSAGAKFIVLFYMITWIYFIASRIFTTGTVSVLHLSVAMFLSLLVYSQRDWGRLLAAVYSSAMAVMVGFEIYSAAIAESVMPFNHTIINGIGGILFLASAGIVIFGESLPVIRDWGGKK
jgi:TRAP-type C4-dicarboxylate transport system permease large subunit